MFCGLGVEGRFELRARQFLIAVASGLIPRAQLPLGIALLLAFACCGDISAQLPSRPASEANSLASELAAWPVIGGREIGCRAAKQSPSAGALRARAQTVIQLYREEREPARAAALGLAHFLRLQAAHQEDITASNALRGYYSRIALAEQLRLNAEAREQVDLEEEKQQALLAGGLAVGSDLSVFARRRIELDDQRLQLEAQDDQLRSLLVQLTNLNYLCHAVYQEELELHPQSLDCAQLKQVALAERADLRAWRSLASRINAESAPEFAKMLPTLVGGWSLPLPTLSGLKLLLCPPDYSALATGLKRELELSEAAQVGLICQTMHERCGKLELSYRRVELAQQTTASWRARLAQLEQLRSGGNSRPEQKGVAQAELLQARSEEIRRRLEARLAEIDLAETTGGLARRCCQGEAWLLTGRE